MGRVQGDVEYQNVEPPPNRFGGAPSLSSSRPQAYSMASTARVRCASPAGQENHVGAVANFPKANSPEVPIGVAGATNDIITCTTINCYR